MKPIRAIVTGSTGFIGRALVSGLGSAFSITPLSRSGPMGTGDLLAPERLPDFPSADVLFHVAGVTGGRTGPGDTAALHQNVVMTANVLEQSRKAGIPRVIYASSYVYGIPTRLPVQETDPARPLSPYMFSKLLCEELIGSYCRWAGQQAVALRIFNLYGPGQPKGFLIPDILAQLDQPVIRLGDPRLRRDFVHVDDVVRAFALAATARTDGFQVFNIGSGTSWSVEQIARHLCKVAGVKAALRFGSKKRAVEIPDVVADITLARRVLGWSPEMDFFTSLSELAVPRPAVSASGSR